MALTFQRLLQKNACYCDFNGENCQIIVGQETRMVQTIQNPTDGFAIKFHGGEDAATLRESGSDIRRPTAAAFCGSNTRLP